VIGSVGGCSHTTEPITTVYLTDYFHNYNFSEAQMIRSLITVIKPKYVGAVLM